MQAILLVLSVIGIALSIIGWFVERAFTLPWLLRYLAPNCQIGLAALDTMRANPQCRIERTAPAFDAIVAHWPRFPDSPTVKAIGRTVAFIEFGSQVTNEIGLTLLDEQLKRIEGHDWTFSQATEALTAPTKRRFHFVGTTVFFLGIGLTLVSAIIQFFTTP